jgi:hypothetical protein
MEFPMRPMESSLQDAARVYEITLPCKGFRLDSLSIQYLDIFPRYFIITHFSLTMTTQTTVQHSRQYSPPSTMDSTPDKEERKREVSSFITPLTWLKTNKATVQSPCTTRIPYASQKHLPPLDFNMADRNCQGVAERSISRTLSKRRKNRVPSNQKRSNAYGTKMMSFAEKMKH